jgi:trigger factor
MTKMKHLLAMSVVAAMLFTVGCSSDNETNEANGNTVENQEEVVTESPMDDMNYSEGLNEDGFFTDVNALENLELVAYDGISIPSASHIITDEVVESNIASLLTNFTTENQVMDRAIENGDTVNIDYVGSVDGVEFEGGSTGGNGTNVTIGVTAYIDDFLEQLIGHMPGEAFDIEVTFPEDYGVEELNGKDAIFAIAVNHISETVTPELTDEFVATNLSEVYDVTTVEAFNDTVKKELQNNAVKGFIQNYIIENTVVNELPQVVLDYQFSLMENYYIMSAYSYNMTVEEYLNLNGIENMEALKEASIEQIRESAEYAMIIQAIAEDANIEITEAILTEYFTEFTGNSDYSQFEAMYGLPYLKNTVLQDAVLDYIAELVVLEN